MVPASHTGVRATVRLERTPLGRDPSLSRVVAALKHEVAPFVLTGRWGLPEAAPQAARTIVAGAAPRWILERGADPLAAFGQVPALVGDAPPGAIGGGLVGWLGFDLGRSVERILGPQPRRPHGANEAHLAWYDDVLRRDAAGTWWVESLASSEDQAGSGVRDAAARWHDRLDREEPAEPVTTLGPMTINRGPAAHRAAVGETIERIYAGELFQANVCLQLEGQLHGDPAGLVAKVLERTDPWYGAWLDDSHGRQLISTSPELFLRRRGRAVLTGPIKGTAPRASGSLDPAADPAAIALEASEKDRAEHVMIVDLMRNDLGRVCDYGSVRPELEPRLEAHAGVWHLVSGVRGELHEGLGDHQLLRATFPPGSVTGAPKVQAMQVIASVEGIGREAYTGAHGLLSPASGLELAVTIRTIETDGDAAWIGVGGGIVADSDPAAELAEALSKAAALVAAAGGSIEHDAAPTARDRAVASARERRVSGITALGDIPWLQSTDHRPDPGDGLLETALVDDEGRAHHLSRHLNRLTASLDELGYPPVPFDLELRIAELMATAEGRARLRILARAEGDALAVELQLAPPPPLGGEPIALAPVIVPGGLGDHKWLDRGLIDQLTTRLGASPLILDSDGTMLETGWANLWWLETDGVLSTPPLDGRLLPGVTRGVLLSRAAQAGLEIHERTRIWTDDFATLPIVLTSARGVSVAALPDAPPEAIEQAAGLARRIAPLLTDTHAARAKPGFGKRR